MENIRYSPNPPDEDLSRYVYDEFQKIREEFDEVNPTFIVPGVATAVTGSIAAGDVTDVQNLHDNSVLQIAEAAGTPGFHVDFDFSNVETVKGFVSHIWYDGSSTHTVVLRAYDWSAAGWDDYLLIPTSSVYGYRTVIIPDENGKKYVDRGSAKLSLYHVTNGNAAHDLYVDYMAILGKRRARY